MKRHLSALVCLLLVIAAVCSLASCDVVKGWFEKPEHTHSYVDGKCDCGESDPDYVAPHEHNFVNGECECGESDPNYVPPTTGTADDPHALTVPGTLNVAFAGGYEPIWYSFTASETKTLGITLSSENADMGYGTSADAMAYTGGKTTYVEVNIEAGVTYIVNFSTVNAEAEEYTVTAEYVTKVSPYETVIKAGNNTLMFSADEIAANEASRKLVINEAGEYSFNGDVKVDIYDANNTKIEWNASYRFDLVAGEYTAVLSMFNIYGVQANTNVTLSVVNKSAEGGDGGEGSDIDITGTYYGTDDFDNQSLTIVIDATTVTFTYSHPMLGEIVASYTYAIIEGEVVLYDDDNNVVPAMGGFITLSINGVPVDAGFNGTNYTLSTTQGGGSGDGDDDDDTLPEVGTGTGTEEKPYIIAIPGDFTCAFPGGVTPIWYAFAAPADGTVTISTTFGENGWLQLGTAPMFCNTNEGDGTSLTLFVEKDTLYYAAVGDWSEVASNVPFSITFTADGEGGGDDGGDDTTEIVTEGYLYDGESEVVITEDQYTAGKVYYAFTPWNEGEYTFQSGDLYVSGVYLDGEALTTNDNGYYELTAYTQYVVEISCAWVSGAGTYTVNAEFQYPQGHQQNPNWLWSLGESVTANYAGDYNVVWYTFCANANGTVTVTTEDTAASIMLTAVFGNEVTNTDADGNLTNSVSLYVMQGREYYIGVVDANWSIEAREIVFTPTFTEGEIVTDGSANLPYGLVIGANTANVDALQNVYYMYTAAENGTLTVTTENANCSWYVTTKFSKFDFSSEASLSIQVYMGQIVYVCVSDVNGAEGEITFNASFKADPKEVYYEGNIINDGSAANEFVIEENTWVSFGFSGAGQYAITWDNADAKVELVAWGMPNTVLASGDVIEGDTYGTYFIVYLPEYAAGTVNVTITPYAAEAEASLVLGNNTITVVDTQNGDSYNLPISEEEVIYTVTAGANGVVIVNGSDIYFEGNSVDITVPAGETVSVNIGAYSFSDNVANVTVAIKGTEVEGGEGEGDGEEEDPVVVIPTLEIGTTPYNQVAKTYSYTASEDGVLTLTTGAAIMNSVTFSYTVNDGEAVEFTVAPGDAAVTKEITLVAGDVVIVNISGSGYSSITVAFGAPSTDEGGEGEEGGEEGGESTDGIFGTYLSTSNTANNSRKMQVIINADGTMTVTRSDMTGNFTGGATITDYTWEMVDGVFTYTKVGSNSITAMTFNADGTPVSVTWSGVVYENYEKQA